MEEFDIMNTTENLPTGMRT